MSQADKAISSDVEFYNSKGISEKKKHRRYRTVVWRWCGCVFILMRGAAGRRKWSTLFMVGKAGILRSLRLAIGGTRASDSDGKKEVPTERRRGYSVSSPAAHLDVYEKHSRKEEDRRR